ncbi:DUF3501 domain-containing protein [Novosphingobium sp. TH158]|nr:DUF3501 domain-containing protein [Novosphingobium sp. TH158]
MDCKHMSRENRSITAADIMPLDQYETIRADKRQEAILRKKLTRLAVGPNATIMFETWDSMWLQIQEMLRIEKGGEAQVPDEIAAYDPMVPKGSELTATLLFEVADPVKRDAFLRTIGGVEDHIALQVGGETIRARPEGDVERTRESDGKASAVHFLHFDFTPSAIAAWKSGEGQAMVVIDHPNYGHAALIGADARSYLARECF